MSVINSFSGYEFKQLEDGKMHNMYRGIDVGKGGWVYSEPGIYTNVALLDVASMHPASIIALNKLGKYTQKYADLRQARIYIKHGDFDSAAKLFDGKLAKYLSDPNGAEALSAALKLPLNSFFGISFASFSNPARDSRDKNNIIALRGALFMKTLFDEIAARGFKVIHNKTDSVKVPNATLEIIKFIQDFAEKYGYTMEHEGTYERICLIDDSQYIATFMKPEECEARYGYIPSDNAKQFKKYSYPWTATGAQFQRPYVFKTLFSGEQVEFDDMCETKKVKGAAIYIDMDEKLPDVSEYEKELVKRLDNQSNSEKKSKKLNPEMKNMDISDLRKAIANGHDYHFVGRVGRFCPIKPGLGGGILTVLRDEKYNAVSGTKGYRWLESEMVREVGREQDIDRNYYEAMVSDSIEKISKFGSFERFIDTSRPYEDDRPKAKAVDISSEDEIEDDDLPWSDLPPIVPCGDGKYNTCMECPNCSGDICKAGYSLAVNGGGAA